MGKAPAASSSQVDELVEAGRCQDCDSISALLALGVNPNAQGQLGITPLVAAAEHGSLQSMQLLIAAHANVNQVCSNGTYPLRAAIQGRWGTGELECVELLLSSGCDVNLESARGTPLIAATQSGDPEAINLLLSHGAHIDHVTRDGTTALMAAVRADRREAVQLLLSRGADPNVTHKDTGKTALDLAQELVLPQVVSLLMQHSITSGADAAVAEAEARQEQGMRDASEKLQSERHRLQQESDQGRRQVAAKVAELQVEKLELIRKLGLKVT